MQPKSVELVAPAGSLEKLEVAIHFGADAVYFGGPLFSLRHLASNFSPEDMHKAVRFARDKGVKTYVTCNTYARVKEERKLAEYLGFLGELHPDGVIVADPGVFMAARNRIPHIPLHISTQANTTSALSAKFWADMGARRIVVARELSLGEIRAIGESTAVEIEAFVHGAMCISHSGRCLLSNFMAGRDANRGHCAHACRWRYAVVEETRPGQYFPVDADEHGTYIFNSRDLCMIDHIPEMIAAGIAALKIEGRMKGLYYLAAAVKTYREALDAALSSEYSHERISQWQKTLDGINLRGYTTGFYLDADSQSMQNEEGPDGISRHQYVGKIVAADAPGRITLDVKNRIRQGETIEILMPQSPVETNCIDQIIDDADAPIAVAQPNSRVTVVLTKPVPCHPLDIVRRPDAAAVPTSAGEC